MSNKKEYEKPRLLALSLAGNEQLCGNCSVPAGDLLAQIKGETGLDLSGGDDGVFDQAELDALADKGLFGMGECKGAIVTNYCKFTASSTIPGAQMLAGS